MRSYILIIIAILPLSLFAQEEELKERAEISLNIRGWNNSSSSASESTLRDSLLNPYTKYSARFSRTFKGPMPSISFTKNNLRNWEFGLIGLRVDKYEKIERIDSNSTSRYFDQCGTQNSYDFDFFIAKHFGFTEKFLPEVFVQINAYNYFHRFVPLTAYDFKNRGFGFRGEFLVGAEYAVNIKDWISCSAGLHYRFYQIGFHHSFVDNPSLPLSQRSRSNTYGHSGFNQRLQLRIGVSFKL